ncbi:MAG: hypothetical protein BRC26_03440 [Nanohaloarchaea archaeon QH_8_44_6]|nr:MAG: hypothetical protein BRC26_03440 [Nanohaloarchaea archaeon QH_8_44_6]
MRALLLTDIHGETEELHEILEREDYEVVLCAGDLSDSSKFTDYEGKLEAVLQAFNDNARLSKMR